MGQLVIRYGVPRIEPFAVHQIAVSKDLPQRNDVMIRPTFKQIELAFAWAAGQDMAPALQDQCFAFVETHSGIRSIQLLLNHNR